MGDTEPGTPWSRAFDAASRSPDFVDLTAFDRWLGDRAYTPDSRGHLAARQAVAGFYREAGAKVADDAVLLTAGTSEAYALLFTTLAEAGDVVLLPRPGYPLFEHLAERARLRTAAYDQPFRWLAPVSDRLKFVVVISPNNPTGLVYTAEHWAAIGEFCRQHGAALVCDEVFDAFVPGNAPLPRPAALLPEVLTFTLNGISKRFGSPDLKLGWIAVTGPAAAVEDAVERLAFSNDLLLSANSYSQALLPRLFREMGPWQERVRGVLAFNRAELRRWLDGHPEVVAPPSDGGIHGLLRWPGLPRGWDDERWSIHLLTKLHLSLHPGYFYDVQEPGTLVYSLLKEPSAFREGLARLDRA